MCNGLLALPVVFPDQPVPVSTVSMSPNYPHQGFKICRLGRKPGFGPLSSYVVKSTDRPALAQGTRSTASLFDLVVKSVGMQFVKPTTASPHLRYDLRYVYLNILICIRSIHPSLPSNRWIFKTDNPTSCGILGLPWPRVGPFQPQVAGRRARCNRGERWVVASRSLLGWSLKWTTDGENKWRLLELGWKLKKSASIIIIHICYALYVYKPSFK